MEIADDCFIRRGETIRLEIRITDVKKKKELPLLSSKKVIYKNGSQQ